MKNKKAKLQAACFLMILVAFTGRFQSIWAAELLPEAEPLVHVIPLHQSRHTQELKGSGVQVHEAKKTHPSELSPREIREKVFAKSGISEALKTWDELDRDLLWLSAKSLDWEELKTQYPQLKAALLRRLFERVHT